ncbi:hypothetical protein J7F03_20935, partial [Streptomyces sp. ISL-43]|uniref:hypothetical protein n=1 Tax=Streptomyces sp. ISL-43 TaxID=2819183 RepID=UPI001BECB63F
MEKIEMKLSRKMMLTVATMTLAGGVALPATAMAAPAPQTVQTSMESQQVTKGWCKFNKINCKVHAPNTPNTPNTP